MLCVAPLRSERASDSDETDVVQGLQTRHAALEQALQDRDATIEQQRQEIARLRRTVAELQAKAREPQQQSEEEG